VITLGAGDHKRCLVPWTPEPRDVTEDEQPVRAATSGSRRRRGRPPAAGGPSTQQRILRTARELFSELGYEKCTFSEIAERAGLTRPAINHYFHSKKDLYDAVFESTEDNVVTTGMASAAAAPNLPGQLTAFLRAASQVDSEDRSYARFITSALLDAFRHPELRDRAHAQLDEMREFVAGSLREAIEAGEVRADLDVGAVSEMLVAVMWGMGLYAGFVGTHDQLESVIDQFSRLLDGSLW